MRKLPILLFTAVFALSLALPGVCGGKQQRRTESRFAVPEQSWDHGRGRGGEYELQRPADPRPSGHDSCPAARRLRAGGGKPRLLYRPVQISGRSRLGPAICRLLRLPRPHGWLWRWPFWRGGSCDAAAACTVILRYLALTDLVWDYNSACSNACDLGLSEPAMTAQGTISRGDLAVMLYRALTGNFQGTSAGAARSICFHQQLQGEHPEGGYTKRPAGLSVGRAT